MKYLKILFALFAVFVFAIVAILYTLSKEPPSEFTALTPEQNIAEFEREDNGYHEIEKALDTLTAPDDVLAKELADIRANEQQSPSVSEYLEGQEAAIALMQQGMDNEFLIIPRYDILTEDDIEVAMQMNMDRNKQLRDIGRMFIWTGNTLEMDGRPGDAANQYLNAVRLGQSNTDGGLLIDAMVGHAIQKLGLKELQLVLDKLSPAELEAVIAGLLDLEQNIIPFGEVLANERAFSEKHMPEGFLSKLIMRFYAKRLIEEPIARSQYANGKTNATLIGLRLRAQVKLWSLQYEQQPTSLAQVLGPDNIPIDPTTGNPFQLDTNGDITSPGQRKEGESLRF